MVGIAGEDNLDAPDLLVEPSSATEPPVESTAGTALKAKLDALASGPLDRIQTRVWDRFELTAMLLSDQFADLLRQFFPKQSARNAAIEIDAAREKIEASVPRQVVGALRTHLVPYRERYASLAGAKIWPHDPDQQKLIDELLPLIFGLSRTKATQKLEELQFDAFLALIDQLIRTFPKRAYDHILLYAQSTDDSARIFNLIEILREFDQFTDAQEHSIPGRCDPEALFDLYHEAVEETLLDTGYWSNTPTEISQFADEVEIVEIDIDNLEFNGGDGVSFDATLRFLANGSSDRGPHGSFSESERFTYKVAGYLDGSRVTIDEIRFRY